MSKESANIKPTLSQMFRSGLPYLTFIKDHLKGSIQLVKDLENKAFYVYLPPNHDVSTENFPVLYHLHGAGVILNFVKHDIYWVAEQHEAAVQKGVADPMIIVAPYDSSRFSMWSDSKDGQNNMARMVVKDIRAYVESTYKARTDRNSRFIQGFSMGGYGAAMLGLKYQDLFASITIFDGAMHNWETLNLGESKIAKNQFGDDEAYFNEWSPYEWAERADLSKTPIFVVEGLMVGYNTRYYDYVKKLGGRITKVSPDCLHDLRCMQAHHGVEAFAFMNSVGTSKVRS